MKASDWRGGSGSLDGHLSGAIDWNAGNSWHPGPAGLAYVELDRW
jgi:hypothetical protein